MNEAGGVTPGLVNPLVEEQTVQHNHSTDGRADRPQDPLFHIVSKLPKDGSTVHIGDKEITIHHVANGIATGEDEKGEYHRFSLMAEEDAQPVKVAPKRGKESTTEIKAVGGKPEAEGWYKYRFRVHREFNLHTAHELHLTHLDVRLWNCLWDHERKDGVIVSHKQLAEWCDCTERAVYYSLARQEKLGLVAVVVHGGRSWDDDGSKKGKGRANKYHIYPRENHGGGRIDYT